MSLFIDEDLKDFFGYGKWVSDCGRVFLFSRNQTSMAGALRACAMIGTTLLAVEYDDKDTCLSKMASRKIPLTLSEYWTSGSYLGCNSKMHWCAFNRNSYNKKMSWTDVKGGDCVTVKFGNGSKFSTAPCDKQMNYICEVRNDGTFGKALQNECMDIWNVSTVDALVFESAYNASALPLNLKCFVKCVGENLDMFSSGLFDVSGQALRLLEEINQADDAKLQTAFSNYESCTGGSGADECEVAASVYQCGRDLAPGMTNQMYTQAKGNITVYKAPTPCIAVEFRTCAMKNLPCIANSTLVDQLAQTQATPEGSIKTSAAGKKYFVAKYTTSSRTDQTVPASYYGFNLPYKAPVCGTYDCFEFSDMLASAPAVVGSYKTACQLYKMYAPMFFACMQV